MIIKRFPGWRYGPNGEAQIFQTADEVPEGWTDNPNDFKKAESAPPAPVVSPEVPTAADPEPFNRAAAVAFLEARGVKVKGTWGEKRISEELAKHQ